MNDYEDLDESMHLDYCDFVNKYNEAHIDGTYSLNDLDCAYRSADKCYVESSGHIVQDPRLVKTLSGEIFILSKGKRIPITENTIISIFPECFPCDEPDENVISELMNDIRERAMDVMLSDLLKEQRTAELLRVTKNAKEFNAKWIIKFAIVTIAIICICFSAIWLMFEFATR